MFLELFLRGVLTARLLQQAGVESTVYSRLKLFIHSLCFLALKLLATSFQYFNRA